MIVAPGRGKDKQKRTALSLSEVVYIWEEGVYGDKQMGPSALFLCQLSINAALFIRGDTWEHEIWEIIDPLWLLLGDTVTMVKESLHGTVTSID